VNAQLDEGLSALMIAASTGCSGMVPVLLAAGADGNKGDVYGNTPLIVAAFNDHAESVKALIAGRVNVNQRSKIGVTALIGAAQRGYAEVVRVLLAAGADVDAKVVNTVGEGEELFKESDTALSVAQRNDHSDIVQLLRTAGAKE